jgi:hypothetical protein
MCRGVSRYCNDRPKVTSSVEDRLDLLERLSFGFREQQIHEDPGADSKSGEYPKGIVISKFGRHVAVKFGDEEANEPTERSA